MVNIEELAQFLVEAKIATYASDGQDVPSQRDGFKELEYSKGSLKYRDSYTGFFCAPGQEIVRLNNVPIWSMAYSGGMVNGYQNDVNFAKQTFAFLKEALKNVAEDSPFRGPKQFHKNNWIYENNTAGDIVDFCGTERILFANVEVFKQNYIGGLIVHK